MNPSKVFLTARWQNLALLNYEVDPALLRPFVPAGTDLDDWNGRVFLSLVGFRFLNARVFGIAFPFHSNFEEVNLRFYVRRRERTLIKRGVVFIREIVPRWIIAKIARTVYNENYLSLPMSHELASIDADELRVRYGWKSGARWNRMSVTVAGDPLLPDAGSEQQFMAEHYWGYATQPDGRPMEYRVAHPPWRVWSARKAAFEGDVEGLYGKQLAAILKKEPSSVFLAEGSEVAVYQARRL